NSLSTGSRAGKQTALLLTIQHIAQSPLEPLAIRTDIAGNVAVGHECHDAQRCHCRLPSLQRGERAILLLLMGKPSECPPDGVINAVPFVVSQHRARIIVGWLRSGGLGSL